MKLRVEQVVLADTAEVDKVGKRISSKFWTPVSGELVIMNVYELLTNRQEEGRGHRLQYLNIQYATKVGA